MKFLTGSCLCQRVKIQIPDQFDFIGNCHCSECRKFSGSPHGTSGSINISDLTFLEGEEFVRYYQKSEETSIGFCQNCGSSLFSKKATAQKYMIRLGILDDTPTQRPQFHIFVGSKAPWYEITDGLPQHQQRPQPSK